MRELRAILNFAESMNISVSANFEGPGKYDMNDIRHTHTPTTFNRNMYTNSEYCFRQARGFRYKKFRYI